MITYYKLSDYLADRFDLAPGEKIYKLALSSGCTCPNRDGTLDTRGCIFCSAGGSGEFAQQSDLSVTKQIEAGKALIRSKAPSARYIAYFQSFTNTYAPAEKLRPLFTEAISHPEVAVLSVATRPDCLKDDVLDLLEELARIKPVWVELGLQTIHPQTAAYIRRGYELPVFDRAVTELKKRGISVIVHLILGLPGETKEDMQASAAYVSRALIEAQRLHPSQDLPSDGIKLQLLHVLRGTDLAKDYEKEAFRALDMDEYFAILKACLSVTDPSLVIHRITGDGAKKDLIAPLWSGDKKRVLNAWTRYCQTESLSENLSVSL